MSSWKEKNDLVVETSLVGVVLNGLSHLSHVKNKAHFAMCLIRGLGGNLNEGSRENFAKEVFHMTQEAPPDSRRPLVTYYDDDMGRLQTYWSMMFWASIEQSALTWILYLVLTMCNMGFLNCQTYKYDPYGDSTANGSPDKVGFNPDPDADIYTEQGVPYPGTAGSGTSGYDSRRQSSYRTQVFRQSSVRRRTPQISSRRSNVPIQTIRVRQYGTRGGVRSSPRRTVYQSSKTGTVMPRFSDLGIDIPPTKMSKYQYVNREPNPVSSSFVRPMSSAVYGRSVPSDQFVRPSSLPSEYSQQVLPSSAWETVSSQQADQGFTGYHDSYQSISSDASASQYQVDTIPHESPPHHYRSTSLSKPSAPYQMDAPTVRDTSYQADAMPHPATVDYHPDLILQPTSSKFQADTIQQKPQHSDSYQLSLASQLQMDNASEQGLFPHPMDDPLHHQISQQPQDPSPPHLTSTFHADRVPQQHPSQYQADHKTMHKSQHPIEALPPQHSAPFQTDTGGRHQVKSQYLRDPVDLTSVKYPAESSYKRSEPQLRKEIRSMVPQEKGQILSSMKYQTRQYSTQHIDRTVAETQQSKLDQPASVVIHARREDRIHSAPSFQPDQLSQERTFVDLKTHEKTLDSRALYDHRESALSPIVAKSQEMHVPPPSLIPGLPRASEFIAGNDVKRTKVPTGKAAAESTSAKLEKLTTKQSGVTKEVAPMKHVPYETVVKPVSDTGSVVKPVSDTGSKPGLDKPTLHAILKYDLTATGSVFLTPETRQRNYIALQNVIKRRRPRKRGGSSRRV